MLIETTIENATRTKTIEDHVQEKQVKGQPDKPTTRKPANHAKCPSGCQSNHDHSSHGETPTVVVGLIRKGPITGCWRCDRKGHTHQNCEYPQVNEYYCHLCGFQGYKIKNCPQCGSAWKANQARIRAAARRKTS